MGIAACDWIQALSPGSAASLPVAFQASGGVHPADTAVASSSERSMIRLNIFVVFRCDLIERAMQINFDLVSDLAHIVL